jgi:holdfast attachment protein HfaA
MPVVRPSLRITLRIAILPLAIAVLQGVASAQTMSTNSAAYNAGWGRTTDQENQAVNPSLRDANGNLIVTNGVIQSGAGASASAFSGGAASSSSGAGAAGATAIGNNLSVVVQGDNNTVVVDSKQTNTGTVTATANASGATDGS